MAGSGAQRRGRTGGGTQGGERRAARSPKAAAIDREGLGPAPRTRQELGAWLERVLGVRVPEQGLMDGSSGPMDYLAHSFFEGREPGRPARVLDCVVWANRGGGKTFLGAVATLLDMIYKPGIEIRLLGGSMEQSRRMHAHLKRFCDARQHPLVAALVKGKITETKLELVNGSEVQLLHQSQRSVRGTRVQKLRCDEVDLFQPGVWEAAQLTTRSKQCGDVQVRGSVECLSTMHVPHGVMHEVVREAKEGTRTLFRWGVVDVLGHCGPEHRCEREDGKRCGLWEECQGRAKLRGPERAGHLTIDDALALKGRVARLTWDAEMLCKHPKRSDAVLPEFDPVRHVVREVPGAALEEGATGAGWAWLGGMDFGYRAPTVVLWAVLGPDGVLWIVDERVERGVVLQEHIRAIAGGLAGPSTAGRGWPRAAWIGVDPAGNATNDHTGLSSVAKMRQAGIGVKSRRMSIHEGLALVRARLAPADGSGPRLYVHERCRKLIESLERYHFPEDDPQSDTPVKRDGFDHAVDALRYLVQNVDQPYRTGLRRY